MLSDFENDDQTLTCKGEPSKLPPKASASHPTFRIVRYTTSGQFLDVPKK